MSVRRALAIVATLIFCGIAAVYLVAARKPDHYQIVRHVQINASPELIFEWIGFFPRWEHWSPWKYRDPSIVNRFEGPEFGIGSKLIWTSKKSGSGEFEFVAYEPNSKVRYSLIFRDWASTSEGEISLQELRKGYTDVSWKIEGKNSIATKVLWTVFGMEKAMAADFDLGLSLLKAKCEAKQSAGVQRIH